MDFFSKSPLLKTLTATVRLLRVDSSVYSKSFLFPGIRACVPGRCSVTSEAIWSRHVGKWLVYSPGVSCHSSLVALDSLLRVRATDLIASHSGAILRQLCMIRLHVLIISFPLVAPSHCKKDILTFCSMILGCLVRAGCSSSCLTLNVNVSWAPNLKNRTSHLIFKDDLSLGLSVLLFFPDPFLFHVSDTLQVQQLSPFIGNIYKGEVF